MIKFKLLILASITVFFASCEDDKPTTKSGVEIIKGQRSSAKRTMPQGFEKFGENDIFIRMEREGNGEEIQKGDIVTLHYKEWLLPKRRKIQDSYERRSPISIRLGHGQVVEGLEQVLEQQRVGAVFQTQIPWQLAYGPDVYRDYPPKSDVIMDVTILGTRAGTPFYDTTGIKPVELNSGVRIYQIEEGNGERALPGKGVEVFYHGYFADGKLFDSSFDRNTPIRIQLGANEVIPGWEEVLSTMRVGDKVTAFIPYYKAYGEGGSAKIPPHTDLYFDMELTAIKGLE